MNGNAVFILGSCNGLVWDGSRHFILLWNPSTRTHKILPNLDAKNGFTRACGFGYDKSTNGYKAMSIFSQDQNYCGVGRRLFIKVEFMEEDRRLSLWYSSAYIYFREILKSSSPLGHLC